MWARIFQIPLFGKNRQSNHCPPPPLLSTFTPPHTISLIGTLFCANETYSTAIRTASSIGAEESIPPQLEDFENSSFRSGRDSASPTSINRGCGIPWRGVTLRRRLSAPSSAAPFSFPHSFAYLCALCAVCVKKQKMRRINLPIKLPIYCFENAKFTKLA